MIVGMPASVTLNSPSAHVAVFDRNWVIGCRKCRWIVQNGSTQMSPNQTEIRSVFLNPITTNRIIEIWRDDVKSLGQFLLNAREQICIRRELTKYIRSAKPLTLT